jgi:predicted permease
VNVGGIDLPLAADRSVQLLSDAMIPVMLVALGIQLVITGSLRWTGSLGSVAVAKLVVAPLVAAGVGRLIGLTGDPLAVVIIQSSMPPAVFCALIALEHDFERNRIPATVASVTVISLATVPVVLALTT